MIGIIGAMSVEVEALKSKMENARVESVGGTEFVLGTLLGKNVVLARCGIGKVFAALCAQTMILRYEVTKIINTGVAGTLTDRLGILDFAISDDVVQHDMDTTAIGDAPGLISGINVVNISADRGLASLAYEIATEQGNRCIRGTVASGDQFINNKDRKAYIKDTFGAIACEMEGAAIGHACYLSGVPFVVIRCISDNASGEAEMEYPEMVKHAAARSQALVESMICHMED